MVQAQFEEKSFEAPLNHQLLAGSPYIYSPGQVLEASLGFDAALWTQNATLWGLFGKIPGPGVPITAPWLWPATGPSPRLPALQSFNLNVFIQYKRPEALTRSYAREWTRWGQNYYRYFITPHQQVALEDCMANLGGNGLVVYASPCFWQIDDLLRHTMAGTLVSETNFVDVSRLNGHARYTYVAAGNAGLALSEPEEVPPISMSKHMGKRIKTAPSLPEGANILELAARAITSAAKVSGLASMEAIDEAIKLGFSHVPPALEESRQSVLEPFAKVAAFCWLTGWLWLVGGPAQSTSPRSADY
ncbi:MAG: hypothetical protein HY898_03910 [Deltaproteobacteria bacterium]|nr:hypothetical protein [Deltaproteobacteria bacterium]